MVKAVPSYFRGPKGMVIESFLKIKPNKSHFQSRAVLGIALTASLCHIGHCYTEGLVSP